MPQENNFVRIILLKNFANYFDRKVFYYRTVKQYKDNANTGYSYKEFSNINFNPNDGIDTQLVLKNFHGSPEARFEIGDYSYLLVCTDTDADPVISRWYIMDAVRNADGIYTLSLRRDVVAETIGKRGPYWEAPFFVERGMLPLDKYNPLLLNDEGMNLNQIKKSETLLYDGSSTPWIVAYFTQLGSTTTIGTGVRETDSEFLTVAQLAAASGVPEAALNQMLGGISIPMVLGNIKLEWAYETHSVLTSIAHYISVFKDSLYELSGPGDNDGPVVVREHAWQYTLGRYAPIDAAPGVDSALFEVAVSQIVDVYDDHSISDLRDMFETMISNQIPGEHYLDEEMVKAINNVAGPNGGKKIFYNNKYYYLECKYTGSNEHAELTAVRGQINLLDDFIEATDYAEIPVPMGDGTQMVSLELDRTDLDGKIFANYNYANASIKLIPAEDPESSYNYDFEVGTSIRYLDDSSYAMLAMPLNSIQYIKTTNPLVTGWTPSKEIMLQLASDLATKFSSNLIDIQILPYAPNIWHKNAGYLNGEQTVNIEDLTEHIDYEFIKDSNDVPVGLVFFETKASTSFSLDIPITPSYNIKEEANTTMYRLCSPNYSGVFEFNLAKVGANISYFDVDITYKPFNPFIRVTPEFSRLYGENFQDGRGLICGGDFSLPVITDQWKTYENNNKMYGQIFARDIQNLETRQDVERFKEPFSVLSGTAVGAGAGALAGSKAGPYGAIAGAVIGAGTGLAGGLLDISQNEKLRREEKQYSIDRFNLNIANIKAMPQSLSKNSCLTQINKLVPFIEFYDCSQQEHEIFKNRITYNGMFIGGIYEINKFFAPTPNGLEDALCRRSDFYFFKAQLIRAEDVAEDNHFLSVLYDEFEKGVYI